MLTNFNPNKLFPFLSIRTKLIVAFSLLSFVPLSIVGVIGAWLNYNSMNTAVLEDLTTDVALFNERTQNFLAGVQFDLAFLADGAQGTTTDILDLLDSRALPVMRARGSYQSIRLLTPAAGERFRSERRAGDFTIIPGAELRAGGYRFYDLMTADLEPGVVTVLPVEMTGEQGQVVSAITAATRVQDMDQILVADILAAELFRATEDGTTANENRVMAIVSGDGHYLYHSEMKTEWNRLLASHSDTTGRGLVPASVLDRVFEGTPGLATTADRIFAFAPLFMASHAGGGTYFIVESADRRAVLYPSRRFAAFFGGILLVFLTLSVIMGYLATSQLAGPIGELQRGTEIITQGDYNHRLAIESNDEIEQLSIQFNKMAETLQDRDQKLADEQRVLEKRVDSRTRELRSEKEKLQVVLDNATSALILLDEFDRVASASAATSSVLGIDPGSAVGKNAADLSPAMATAVTDFEESLIVVGDEDSPRHLECRRVALNPESILRGSLIVVTDATDRKRLEAQLVRSERLAATGEMAAIVAHEIRNALTSVKMILQLQLESTRADKERVALEVAVQSLRRTEDIVVGLLRFARPTTLTLRKTDLNQIVGRSLAFIKPAAAKCEVKLDSTLNGDLPGLQLDSQLCEEAIVNVLLNAVQASSPGNRVEVSTASACLDEDLQDWIDAEPGESPRSRHRIELRSGQRIVVLKVRDRGEGISEAKRDRLFQPFFTTKQEGTGLGLTMVKRTVNKHGGIALLGNAKGGGAEFRIILPVEASQ